MMMARDMKVKSTTALNMEKANSFILMAMSMMDSGSKGKNMVKEP